MVAAVVVEFDSIRFARAPDVVKVVRRRAPRKGSRDTHVHRM